MLGKSERNAVLTIAGIKYAMSCFPKESLFICTSCFQLTGLVQNTIRCACEPIMELDDPMAFDPTRALLCVLCARARVPGGAPYAWQGCWHCKTLKGRLYKRLGEKVWMEPISANQYEIAKHFSKDEAELTFMTEFLDARAIDWRHIFDWGRNLAVDLWQTVPEWAKEKYIGINAWEKQFPRSVENSEAQLVAFYGLQEFGTLENACAELERRREVSNAK